MEIRKKVILRLIECLTPTASFDIFMDNHFTSFRLLTHLNKIRATRVLVTQMRYHWEQTAAKKTKHGHLEQRTSSKKQCNFGSG